jgi:Ca-activated chloride channel family protein
MIPLSWDEIYFAQKWAFVLVALVAALPAVFYLVHSASKHNHPEGEFVSKEMHDRLLDDGTNKSRFQPWANGLLWISAVLVALALTRPQWGLLEQTVQQEGLDIVIAVDLSSSMRATDLNPSRIESARRELAFLVEELRGNRIGLVGFAGSAFLFCPLTVDTDAVEMFLGEMTIEAVPVPGTALGDAVKVAMETFQMSENQEDGSKVLLLLTDGEDHESQPIELAQQAAEQGIIIDTIGIGTAEGALIPEKFGGVVRNEAGEPVRSQLDGAVLQEMAEITGGMFLRLDDSSNDLDTYLSRLKKRQTRNFGSKTEVLRQERFILFLGLAGILFLLALLLEEIDKRR